MAQGGGGGGGQRGMRGMRGFGGGSPAMLLNRTDVQKDLKLTDDQKTKLAAARQDMQDKMRAAFQNGGGGGQPDQAAMQARMAEMQKMQADFATTVKGILTPEQADRLLGIFVQLNGTNAITNAEVQSKLGLTSDQTAKIKALQDGQMKATQELGQKMRNQEIDMQAFQDTMKKNNDTMKSELEKVLTDDQKSKLKALEGAKFEAEQQPGRGGFGGGGGGN
jgi:hypothetical protein